MQHTDYDVVIVGADPTWLMAAYLLQRYGVRFRIIDKVLSPQLRISRRRDVDLLAGAFCFARPQ